MTKKKTRNNNIFPHLGYISCSYKSEESYSINICKKKKIDYLSLSRIPKKGLMLADA